jgi:shikimate dehydrogenase
VIGHPVEHSLSPVLHRAAYAALGLQDWTYDALDTPVDGLAERLVVLDGGWAGLSVTMPHKRAVGASMHHLEPLAEVLGVVNTVLVQPGEPVALVGANTDVHGIVTALREGYASGGAVAGRSVVVGGGATAASALAALAQLGQTAPQVQVRSVGRAGPTMRAAHRMGLEPRFVAMSDPSSDVAQWRDADTIVVTLPPGSADRHAEALLDAGERVGGVLLDCAYHPRPTALASAWAALGGRVVAGERMLLHQAAEQVRLMTGRRAPLAAMGEALAAALAPGD